MEAGRLLFEGPPDVVQRSGSISVLFNSKDRDEEGPTHSAGCGEGLPRLLGLRLFTLCAPGGCLVLGLFPCVERATFSLLHCLPPLG